MIIFIPFLEIKKLLYKNRTKWFSGEKLEWQRVPMELQPKGIISRESRFELGLWLATSIQHFFGGARELEKCLKVEVRAAKLYFSSYF